MTGITVRDVWRGSLPQGTELLAGGSGLDRRVEWATALRTRPPAFDAVRGGEVAFVPMRSIRLLDERLDLGAVMRSLAEKGGVAVAVLGDAPADALALADALRMPLLRLPDAAVVADAQQATVRYIVDQRTLWHDREQHLRLELTELALSGAGAPAIADRLAVLVGAVTVVQDGAGAVTHISANAVLPCALAEHTGELMRWAATVRMLAADPPVREFALDNAGLVQLVAPIPLRDGIGGFVSVLGQERALGHLARLAVTRAASACAIELDRQRAVLKAREDLEGGVLDALLVGGYVSEQALLQRAQRLGVALDAQLAVIAVRCHEDPDADRVLAAMQNTLRRVAGAALSGLRHGVGLGLVSGVAPRAVADAVHRDCVAALDHSVSVGVGRAHPGIDGARQSFREAEQALGMGLRLFGGGVVTDFAELGLHRLLFAMSGHAELAQYFADHAGALAAYDERTGAGLMATLEAFFRSRNSPTEAAVLLHLHRNTVLYRLRRIEEIAGIDLNDSDTRLNLQLCLRVREVLRART